jgi:hypothetical protein
VRWQSDRTVERRGTVNRPRERRPVSSFASWHHMPDEVMAKAFETLPHLEPNHRCQRALGTLALLRAVPAVCRHWRKACKDFVTVDLLLEDFYARFRCSSILRAVCPRFKAVRSIRVGGALIDFHPDRALADGALLLEVLARCPRLELLDLWSCPGVRPAIVSKAAACCPLLTTIYLGDTGEEPIEDAQLSELAAGCPRLRCVKLSRCKAITDIGVACMLKHCTALARHPLLRRCERHVPGDDRCCLSARAACSHGPSK